MAVGALFWAGHIILIGIVMAKLKTPFQFAFTQNCLCVLFGLLPTVLLEGPALADFWPVLPELLYAGVFSVGVAYTLQMMAQGYASTTLAAFILSLESVFAALSGWLLLDRGLSPHCCVGLWSYLAAIIIADVFPDSWFRRPASSLMNSPQLRLTGPCSGRRRPRSDTGLKRLCDETGTRGQADPWSQMFWTRLILVCCLAMLRGCGRTQTCISIWSGWPALLVRGFSISL